MKPHSSFNKHKDVPVHNDANDCWRHHKKKNQKLLLYMNGIMSILHMILVHSLQQIRRIEHNRCYLAHRYYTILLHCTDL